jgi:hypothetical protein
MSEENTNEAVEEKKEEAPLEADPQTEDTVVSEGTEE